MQPLRKSTLRLLAGLLAVSLATLASDTRTDFRAPTRVHTLPLRKPGRTAPAIQSQLGDPANCLDGDGTCHVNYYGGKVISNVKVYQVNWGSSVDSSVASKFPGFWTAITNSSFLDWLREYDTTITPQGGGTGSNQHIGRGTYAGAFTITPANTASTLSNAMIATELNAQISAHHLPAPDANTIYSILFPPSVSDIVDDPSSSSPQHSCKQFCAYHSTYVRAGSDVYYAVIPDHGSNGCDVGCGNGTVFENTCVSSSHELVEAITDAEVGIASTVAKPLAWYDTKNGETGDMCDLHGDQIASVTSLATGTSYKIQEMFSNLANGCVPTRTEARDFSVFMNPNTASIAAGQAFPLTIKTATTAGASQTLTISVSSLPAGLTASFPNGNTVASGSDLGITLTAVASPTAATDAVVTVTATGASFSHSAGLLVQLGGTVSTTPDFSISLSPSSQSIQQGNAGTYSVSTTALTGFSGNIALTITGLPSNVTGEFVPATVAAGGTSTLTLTVDASASVVSGATFVVTGTSGSLVHSANADLSVTAAGSGSNTFSLAVSPDTRTIVPSSAATFTVASHVTSGTAESIALSIPDGELPTGVTAAFNPATITAGASSTLTLTAAANAPSSSSTLDVFGEATSDSEYAPVGATLNVVLGDYSLSVTPANSALTVGGTKTYTVNSAVLLGAPGTLTLSIADLPTGVTGEFDADHAAGTPATLTLTAAADAPVAAATTFTVTADDSADGLEHTATAQVSVVAVGTNDFSVAVSPGTLSVQRGASGTLSVTTAVVAGSAQTIALTAAGLPSGVTGTFSPSSVSAGQGSTLTLAANSSATLVSGSTVTITGTATSGTHDATALLTVTAGTTSGPPSVSIDSPAAGATLSGSVNIHAAATPQGTATISKVEIFVDGVSKGSTSSSSATVAWNTAASADGVHSLTARATDSNGLSTTSAAVSVTTNNGTSGADGGTGSDAGDGSGSGAGAGGGGCSSAGGSLALLGLAGALVRRRRAQA